MKLVQLSVAKGAVKGAVDVNVVRLVVKVKGGNDGGGDNGSELFMRKDVLINNNQKENYVPQSCPSCPGSASCREWKNASFLL